MDTTPGRGMLPTPPDVIVFDVVETLFSLASLEPLLAAAGGDGSTLGTWFSHLLADGFALTAAGDYRAFRDVAKASLRQVLPHAKSAAREEVLAGLAHLDVQPDSGPAMGRAVQEARVMVVTNSSTDSTRGLLARGGLDAFVEEIVSAEDVRVWKPGADPYSQAAAVAGVPVERLALVTVHPWDVFGAKKAGLGTGWCNRNGDAFPATFGKPDVTGANLLEVVESLFSVPAPA